MKIKNTITVSLTVKELREILNDFNRSMIQDLYSVFLEQIGRRTPTSNDVCNFAAIISDPQSDEFTKLMEDAGAAWFIPPETEAEWGVMMVEQYPGVFIGSAVLDKVTKNVELIVKVGDYLCCSKTIMVNY